MEDLQSTLQSILSDPEQMARVASLAESLGLKPPEETPPSAAGQAGPEETPLRPGIQGRQGQGAPPLGRQAGQWEGAAPSSGQDQRQGATASPPLPGLNGLNGMDPGALMGRLAALNGAEDRILGALRPALSPAGQGKVDRALRAAKLSRLAGQFLAQGRSGHV